MDCLKVGFIGFGNHAKRLHSHLVEIIGEMQLVKFHPARPSDSFDSILACDAVFITSPNDTHFYYLNRLCQESDCYIFCEKPPCSNLFELSQIEDFADRFRQRVFFDFNYRFSKLSQVLSCYAKKNFLGEISYINAVMTHGLAFKKGYPESWRGRYDPKKSVVLDTVLIHVVDLLLYRLPIRIELTGCYKSSLAHGNDSIGLSVLSQTGAVGSLYSSYAAPYSFGINIIGTNGMIEISTDKISVKSPRDTFGLDGCFVSPPAVYESVYSFSTDYEKSVRLALDFFITRVLGKQNFRRRDFDASVATMKLVLACG